MYLRTLCLTMMLFSAASGGQPVAVPSATLQGPDTTVGAMTVRFYGLHGAGLAWSGSQRADADAKLAVAVLSRAAAEGLDPARYRVVYVGDPQKRDLAVSSAMLTYMRDLADGSPDFKAVDKDVGLPERNTDVASLLDEALRHGRLAAMLDGLSPRHPDYAFLKSALASASDETRDLIAANMERWRWLPANLESDRVMVNAANAQLQLWLDGKVVLTSRVIVGKPATPTPILRAEGAGVTLNPTWTVPHSIAVKEILPKLKKNPSYLAKQDMVLLNGPAGDPHGLSVNWRAMRAGTFPYQIRQERGPRNPLGQIKLELPNIFDVYLHDTPARSAFAREDRALSHGCVRVEQIQPLARYALAGPDADVRIEQAIRTGETKYLPLRRKLPVYFLYWTASAGTDGTLQVNPDIYGRDRRLIAAMKGTPMRLAQNLPNCMRG